MSYGLAYVAVALMFVGLGFKIACAPFHIWTPDVYEGAPAPVVATISISIMPACTQAISFGSF